MTDNHRELLGIVLSVSIALLTAFICHRFIPSLIWAAIISMATFTLFERFKTTLGLSTTLSALFFTVLVSLILIFPISWLVSVLITETQWFINELIAINQHGRPAPSYLLQIPVIGDDIFEYWQTHFAKPGMIKQWLASLHLSLTPASYYLKQIGISVAERSVQLAFTLLSLFFFYRDGHSLIKQVDLVGSECFGIKRWKNYAHQLPCALRATVNGTVLVGLGVGLIMGSVYWLLGFPAPALAGFFTAIAAMIPFVVPVVFLVVALMLWSKGSLLAAVFLLFIGTIVMFIADHFVKPYLIGGNTQLPFLVVLFGILGGVETLGILGLFLGPIVMVLFMTLWKEPQS